MVFSVFRYNDGSQIKTLRDEEMRNNLILNPSILHRYAKIPKSGFKICFIFLGDGKLKFTLKFKNENQIVPNRDLKTVFLNLMINWAQRNWRYVIDDEEEENKDLLALAFYNLSLSNISEEDYEGKT